MNLLNVYFVPFGAVLVVVALYFSGPEARSTSNAAFGILGGSLAVNFWFSKYAYRFVGWTNALRNLQVGISFLVSVLLFYMLFPFCAPTWLLVVLPAVAAALHQGRWQTLLTGLVSGAAVLGVYYIRWHVMSEMEMGPEVWSQAFIHAAFIPVLSMFVYSLAQTALKLMRARL
jgi:hypothetical protein